MLLLYNKSIRTLCRTDWMPEYSGLELWFCNCSMPRRQLQREDKLNKTEQYLEFA